MRYGGTRERRGEVADPKHPGHFTEESRRQMAKLHNGGKPPHEIMAEHGPGRSTLWRWISAISTTGSSRAADNRTPGRSASSSPLARTGALGW